MRKRKEAIEGRKEGYRRKEAMKEGHRRKKEGR